MELIEGGSLHELLYDRLKTKAQFTDKEVSKMMRSILSALAHMHEQDTLHRDLKPSNLLLADRNDLSSIKIIDFGLSEKYVLKDDKSGEQGTLFYMAPEVVMGNGKISKSVDIWAIGIIMFQLLSGGSHPYSITPYDPRHQFLLKIQKAKGVDILQNQTFLSAISKKFLERLICVDRTFRYTAKDALQHPWITRQKQNRIPLNLVDQMQMVDYEKQLRRKFNIIHFLSIQKLFQQSQELAQSTAETEQNESEPFSCKDDLKSVLSDIGQGAYKKKLLFFSKRIDHWHLEQSNINSGIFEHDEDFVELDRSPSKFTNLSADHTSLDEFLLGNSPEKQEPFEEDFKEQDDQQDITKPTSLNSSYQTEKLQQKFTRKAVGSKYSLSPNKKQSQPGQGKVRRAFFPNQQHRQVLNKSKVVNLKLKELSPIRVDEESEINDLEDYKQSQQHSPQFINLMALENKKQKSHQQANHSAAAPRPGSKQTNVLATAKQHSATVKTPANNESKSNDTSSKHSMQRTTGKHSASQKNANRRYQAKNRKSINSAASKQLYQQELDPITFIHGSDRQNPWVSTDENAVESPGFKADANSVQSQTKRLNVTPRSSIKDILTKQAAEKINFQTGTKVTSRKMTVEPAINNKDKDIISNPMGMVSQMMNTKRKTMSSQGHLHSFQHVQQQKSAQNINLAQGRAGGHIVIDEGDEREFEQTAQQYTTWQKDKQAAKSSDQLMQAALDNTTSQSSSAAIEGFKHRGRRILFNNDSGSDGMQNNSTENNQNIASNNMNKTTGDQKVYNIKSVTDYELLNNSMEESKGKEMKNSQIKNLQHSDTHQDDKKLMLSLHTKDNASTLQDKALFGSSDDHQQILLQSRMNYFTEVDNTPESKITNGTEEPSFSLDSSLEIALKNLKRNSKDRLNIQQQQDLNTNQSQLQLMLIRQENSEENLSNIRSGNNNHYESEGKNMMINNDETTSKLMKTTERPIKSKKQKKNQQEQKRVQAGKKWLNYISEGPHYSLNTTTNNANNSSTHPQNIGGTVKKSSKKWQQQQQQQQNAQQNSAEIIEHMKRQNLTGETLNKLLISGANTLSITKQQINTTGVGKSSPVKIKKATIKQLQQQQLQQHQIQLLQSQNGITPQNNSTEFKRQTSQESFIKSVSKPVQRTKTNPVEIQNKYPIVGGRDQDILTAQKKVIHEGGSGSQYGGVGGGGEYNKRSNTTIKPGRKLVSTQSQQQETDGSNSLERYIQEDSIDDLVLSVQRKDFKSKQQAATKDTSISVAGVMPQMESSGKQLTGGNKMHSKTTKFLSSEAVSDGTSNFNNQPAGAAASNNFELNHAQPYVFVMKNQKYQQQMTTMKPKKNSKEPQKSAHKQSAFDRRDSCLDIIGSQYEVVRKKKKRVSKDSQSILSGNQKSQEELSSISVISSHQQHHAGEERSILKQSRSITQTRTHSRLQPEAQRADTESDDSQFFLMKKTQTAVKLRKQFVGLDNLSLANEGQKSPTNKKLSPQIQFQYKAASSVNQGGKDSYRQHKISPATIMMISNTKANEKASQSQKRRRLINKQAAQQDDNRLPYIDQRKGAARNQQYPSSRSSGKQL